MSVVTGVAPVVTAGAMGAVVVTDGKVGVAVVDCAAVVVCAAVVLEGVPDVQAARSATVRTRSKSSAIIFVLI